MISVGPNTPLAFCSIFTSSYPSMFGGYTFLGERITLSEVLHEAGITTAGIHSNPHLISLYGYGRGFDYFYDDTQRGSKKVNKMVASFRKRYREKFKAFKILTLIDKISENQLLNILVYKFITQPPYEEAEIINQKAIKWLARQNLKKRFFLWLHYMEPHIPYIIKKGYKKKDWDINNYKSNRLILKARKAPQKLSGYEKEVVRLLYLSQIEYLEDRLGELLNFLIKSGVIDDTIIFFSADHGMELFEHKIFGYAPIWYKKGELKLFNTILKVPFLIYGPKINSKVEDGLISSIDIAPTICALLGIKPPKKWLGRNFLSPNFIRNLAVSEQVYFEDKKIYGAFAFQTLEEKFIYDFSEQIYRYYNLKQDPAEEGEYIRIYHQKRKKIEELYLSHKKNILTRRKYQKFIIPGKVDSEIKRRLKSLGYFS
jgi:arylsulfatase A-like enzyme